MTTCNHYGTLVFEKTEQGVKRTCTICGFTATEIGRQVSGEVIRPIIKYKKKQKIKSDATGCATEAI